MAFWILNRNEELVDRQQTIAILHTYFKDIDESKIWKIEVTKGMIYTEYDWSWLCCPCKSLEEHKLEIALVRNRKIVEKVEHICDL